MKILFSILIFLFTSSYLFASQSLTHTPGGNYVQFKGYYLGKKDINIILRRGGFFKAGNIYNEPISIDRKPVIVAALPGVTPTCRKIKLSEFKKYAKRYPQTRIEGCEGVATALNQIAGEEDVVIIILSTNTPEAVKEASVEYPNLIFQCEDSEVYAQFTAEELAENRFTVVLDINGWPYDIVRYDLFLLNTKFDDLERRMGSGGPVKFSPFFLCYGCFSMSLIVPPNKNLPKDREQILLNSHELLEAPRRTEEAITTVKAMIADSRKYLALNDTSK